MKQKNSKWINQFNVEKILNLDKDGKNIREIANNLGIPEKRLSEMLREHNIKLKSTYQRIPKNNDFFKNIDNEIKAYLLGYIIADGCVTIEPKKKNGKVYSYSKRLCFCSSVDDYEVINLLKESIAPTTNIRKIKNNKGALNRKEQIVLRISSSSIVDDLINLGIKPRKTEDIDFTFDFNKIDNKLIHHFIRGFFDGDGSVNKTSISFVGTSLNFLNQIENIFKINIPNVSCRISKEKGKNLFYYHLFINMGHGNREKVFNYLYANSNYSLSRKRYKFNIDDTVLTS